MLFNFMCSDLICGCLPRQNKGSVKANFFVLWKQQDPLRFTAAIHVTAADKGHGNNHLIRYMYDMTCMT